MLTCKPAATLLSLLLIAPSWAGTPKPEALIILKNNQVSMVFGLGPEPHEMESLAQFGAPGEYVNGDLEKLNLNEGPCIYVAGPAALASPAAYGVAVECFDLVAEKETKSLLYAADSDGKLVTDRKLSLIGEYGKDDNHFDLAAWQWVSKHISPKLEQRIAADRAQDTSAMTGNLYKVNASGKQAGPKVTAPVLIRSVEPEFSDIARRRRIAGWAVISLVVDTKGRPQIIRSVLPAGFGLDEEAVKAVQQYRFEPSKLDGKAVPVRITIEVNFHPL